MGNTWAPTGRHSYALRDRQTGALKWTATRVDLVFWLPNAVLRACAECTPGRPPRAVCARLCRRLGEGDERRSV